MKPGLKIGVVGKGGVGKTTVSSLLARTYASQGLRVVAVDTDSNPNLAMSLGLDLAATEAIPVLPRSIVVGSRGDCAVDELFDTYGVLTPSGVTVLSALRVTEAGAGCTCGGHSTVRSLLGEALEARADVTIVDMEAGIEHLSRSGGTLAHADILVIVMDPSRKSVVTASRTIALAAELGITRCVAIGNKANLSSDADFFTAQCAELGVPLVGVIPMDAAVTTADRAGERVDATTAPALWEQIERLVSVIDERVPA
jgi:CO dehydrogenase maturation factor